MSSASVIALTSVTGAPGVTTTAVAWAYLSDRPTLVVEADPVGGSAILAGRFGGRVRHSHSLLALAELTGQRQHEHMRAALAGQRVLLPGTEDRAVVPAVATADQSRTMTAVWHPLGRALRSLARDTGIEVVIDLGRARVGEGPWPLAVQADVLLVMTDGSLPSIARTQVAAAAIREDFATTGSPHRVAVAPVLDSAISVASDRPFTASSIGQVMTPTTVMAPVARDAGKALHYSTDLDPKRPRALTSSTYASSVRRLIEQARAHAHANAQLLGEETP